MGCCDFTRVVVFLFSGKRSSGTSGLDLYALRGRLFCGAR